MNKEGRFEIQNLGQQPAGLTVNEYRPRRSPTGQESKPEHTSISEALGTAGMADKSEVPVASGQIQQGLGTYDQESSLSPTEGALDLAKLNGDEENSPKTALREFDEETKSDKFESKNETMQALIAAVEALPIDQREGQLKASVGVVIEHLEALAYLPEQERRGKTDEIQQSIADMTGLFRAYANETIHDLSALLNNLKESDQTRVNEIISGLHEELEKGAKAGDDLFKEFGESTTIDWNRLQELFGRLKSPFSAQSNARKAIVQLLNRV